MACSAFLSEALFNVMLLSLLLFVPKWLLLLVGAACQETILSHSHTLRKQSLRHHLSTYLVYGENLARRTLDPLVCSVLLE